jgi:mitogen-activated protein kinase organizer 1
VSLEVELLFLIMAPSRGPVPLARSLHAVLDNHKGAVNVARYSKGTANYILTGGQDRTIRLWNAHQGTEIKTFAAHGYEILSITVYVCFNIPLLVILTISKITG